MEEVNKDSFLDKLKGLLNSNEIYYVLVPDGTGHYGLKKAPTVTLYVKNVARKTLD